MIQPLHPTADDFAPAWARRAVWYQIYPERFRNGDPANDPTPDSLQGSHRGDDTAGWQVHPWTADWYALQPYERSSGGSIWTHLQRRRYGGDLQGIIDKLDYLEDLGVNALYLTPVFVSPSAHKYDSACHHHVDPHFGPDPAGDKRTIAAETPEDPAGWAWTSADRLLLELIARLHARGMRIILDGVFNHVGSNNFAFRDVVEKQRASRFAGWFKVRRWASPETGDGFEYDSWYGHKSLPELRQDDNGIVSGPREYLYAATRRWMAPAGVVADGIDGWRLDDARQLAHPFWKDWRRLVKSINPDAYLVSEIMKRPDFIAPYLQGDEFDAVMNYGFASACTGFVAGGERGIEASDVERLLARLRQAYPPCVSGVMQNLVGSHDTARVASRIVNRARFDDRDFNQADDPPPPRQHQTEYDTRKPDAYERRLHKLLVVMQMTYLGAPMVYYGDEAGMWGALDPCCRKPMLWPDLRFDNEVALPDGGVKPSPDRVEFDPDLFAHYRQLIALRRSLDALQVGDYATLLVDDARRVFAYARRTPEQTVCVALNGRDEGQAISLPLTGGGAWHDALDGGRSYSAAAGRIELSLAPLSGAILVHDRG